MIDGTGNNCAPGLAIELAARRLSDLPPSMLVHIARCVFDMLTQQFAVGCAQMAIALRHIRRLCTAIAAILQQQVMLLLGRWRWRRGCAIISSNLISLRRQADRAGDQQNNSHTEFDCLPNKRFHH